MKKAMKATSMKAMKAMKKAAATDAAAKAKAMKKAEMSCYEGEGSDESDGEDWKPPQSMTAMKKAKAMKKAEIGAKYMRCYGPLPDFVGPLGGKWQGALWAEWRCVG